MNLPNKITIARILMIFLFLLISNTDDMINNLLGENFVRPWKIFGFVIAIIAGLTDFIDGYIARKYNMITDFGRLMDPMADKIFITTAFIVLVESNILSGWIAVIILSREFLVTGLRLLAASKGTIIPADNTGKLKTILQMVFLILGGAIWTGLISKEDSILFKSDIKILWILSLSIIVFITVFSGITYFVKHRNLFLNLTKNGEIK
ncbi:MAG TPA: CDP-diacylglycerol--glycerol-3-phosphate 3-phosphatidyltransferase [Victivallales bacterium]|nr:CDP-diacylglycerol--glycerol-3-phosphate 3-phosphatidyltransferase [Victivallales bacterium]HPO89775.1 CDP-diacylglycerol--glycerol-3-phosphate 3-phosphatidyltransferase [Victivallales bacterium]HRU01198.1 CDP-diacylglycerol--glycerol-3-phosphate 3-phosphatidyltransferase [Victivallales bacterium]